MDIQILNARADAIAYISSGRKPSGKIRNKLIHKGYPPEVIEEVISELTEDGRVNDEAYAAAVIKSRSGSRIVSSSAMEYNLIRSGVPKAIAANAVKDMFNSRNNDAFSAYQLLDLKFASKADKILENDKGKQNSFLASMYRFLVSRGFEDEIAAEVVRKFLNDRICKTN